MRYDTQSKRWKIEGAPQPPNTIPILAALDVKTLFSKLMVLISSGELESCKINCKKILKQINE